MFNRSRLIFERIDSTHVCEACNTTEANNPLSLIYNIVIIFFLDSVWKFIAGTRTVRRLTDFKAPLNNRRKIPH